jgi:hypothetical protein
VGKKAIADYTGALNANANTLTADPTHFENILHESEVGLANMPQIPAGQRDKLLEHTRNTLALAAGRGLIDANPMVAMKEIQSGKYDAFITPEQKHALIQESFTEMRAVEVMAEKLKKQAEEQAKLQRDTVNNDFLDKYEQGALTWDDVKKSTLLPMGEGSKDFWLNMLHRQATEGVVVKTDPSLYWDLSSRINLPWGDPRKITDPNQLLAYQDRMKISDLKDLRGQVFASKGEDGGKLGTDIGRFLESVRPQFIKPSAAGLPDPTGEQSFYNFQYALRQQAEQYRQGNKDPRELLDPNSKAYFGALIKTYQPSQAQRLQAQVESAQQLADDFAAQKRLGVPGGIQESGDQTKLPEVVEPNYPVAPRDPKQLQVGKVYQFPTGVGTWTGKGVIRGHAKKTDANKHLWSE